MIDIHASWYASYIQEQVNTQGALGSTLTAQESASMGHHERTQNACTADQSCLLSSQKFLRLAIPPFPNVSTRLPVRSTRCEVLEWADVSIVEELAYFQIYE